MEMAPPSTLSFSIGMPSLSRQYTTCTANASFSSQRSIWSIRRPKRSSSRGTAKTGPMPISSGSHAATVKPRKMPSGWRPRRSASLASITTHADAPSESWLALPAVIWPFSPRTGVLRERDLLLAHLAGGPVLRQLRRGDGHDFLVEAASRLARGRALLARQRVLVLLLARDVVALGHHLGRVDHRHVDLGLVLVDPRLVNAEVVEVLVLHE